MTSAEPLDSARSQDHEIDDDDEDLSALDTLEFAGIIESGDFDAVAVPRARQPLDIDEGRAATGSSPSAAVRETAVELLADTGLEMAVMDPADVLPPPVDAMPLYEELRGCCEKQFAAVAAQVATRSGRVVVSSIADRERRLRLAEFSCEAIRLIAHHDLDEQCALLHAGEVHVLVVAVDEIRVFTALFAQAPALADLVAALQPFLQDFRRRRGER
jgi:hypothetical protein